MRMGDYRVTMKKMTTLMAFNLPYSYDHATKFGALGSALVEALCYKQKARGFETR
jgi:hypothetical protein